MVLNLCLRISFSVPCALVGSPIIPFFEAIKILFSFSAELQIKSICPVDYILIAQFINCFF